MAGPRSEATRKKLADAQRRSWREHRAARLQALQNPEVHARRMKSIKKLDDAKVLELHDQGLSQGAIAKRFDVSHAAIHYSLKRQHRLPTSKALECVRRRMAEREAKQAGQPPPGNRPRTMQALEPAPRFQRDPRHRTAATPRAARVAENTVREVGVNAQLTVMLLYMAGSLCFFVGTGISLWEYLK